MFAFRAHNAVNARLSKPVYKTLDECLAVLKTNIQSRTPADYRVAYINHITRHWRMLQDVSGIVALKKIAEMRKIETDYVAPRDTRFEVTLADVGVVVPRDWMDGSSSSQTVAAAPSLRFSMNTPVRAGFQMVGGRIRLR